MAGRKVQWDATHQGSIMVLTPFSGFIPGFSSVMRQVVSDVPLDDEAPVLSGDFENLQICRYSVFQRCL
jgi:hypothetical protein